MGCIVMKNDDRNKHIRMLFLSAIITAVLLRWFYVATLPDALIWSDEREYIRLAHTLSQGEGFVTHEGRPTADRAPGYPLWMSVLALVHLDSPTSVRLAQVLLSTACLLLLYGMARQMGDYRRALVALWLGTLYPYFIYMVGAVLPTTLFSFLLLAAVYWLVAAVQENRLPWFFASGAVFGLAVLTVPTAAVLVLVAGLWLGIKQRRAWRHTAWFFAGCLLMTSPWIIRNYNTLGVWQVSTSDGYNFWLGNNPDAQINYPGSIEMSADMQNRLSTIHDEKEKSRLYQQEALQYIVQQPFAAVWRTLIKAGYFWRLDPSPATQSYVEQSSSIRWIGILTFTFLLALAIIGGLTMNVTSKRILFLWLAFACAFTIVHALTIVKVRFRLPLDHFMLLAAAFGLVWVGEQAFAWRQGSNFKSTWSPKSLDFGSEADWSQLSIERKGIV
jgi:4-amino-4-deoxy-L-arabinose transferase-like glycosyltransferase